MRYTQKQLKSVGRKKMIRQEERRRAIADRIRQQEHEEFMQRMKMQREALLHPMVKVMYS